ncbi:MAG TPA: glycosyltransferase family 4 protein, partial [Bacteroidota bacterium]|nr:glycosyltransferase family 4 protein [Bacteroidota bacterium]
MKRDPHILFTATFRASFIQQDAALLGELFPLTTIVSSGPKTVFRYLASIRRATITYSWFASVYSSFLVLLARCFRKRSIIVLGGIDVADMRELGYGIWNSRWRAPIVRYGIMNADAVIAVDGFLKSEAQRLARYDGANIDVVPTGYDGAKWKPSGEKRPFVLMVASTPDEARVKIKGVDFFLDVARSLPDVEFVLVGPSAAVSRTLQIPPNVRMHEFLAPQELLRLYQQAKVYTQLSMREGLPNALCEAMLCECTPVGTKSGGIPTAIGDAGYLCEHSDIEAAQHHIKAALHAPSERGRTARKRILEQFTIERRRDTLKALVERLNA